MQELDLSHFEELRSRINARLTKLRTQHRKKQIEEYPWLYGALGAVPSEVMFICENPSLTGIQSADAVPLDDGPADIEAQWWGGPKNNAAKRFRVVLHELGLKTTPPESRGGWNCYITNVVKEANFAKDQKKKKKAEKREQARQWADILLWELEQVRPTHVFAVGDEASARLSELQGKPSFGKRRLPEFPVHPIWHYSRYQGNEEVIANMTEGIQRVLGG